VTSGAGAAGGVVGAEVDSGPWAKALVKAYNTAAAVNEATVLVMQILPGLSSNDEVATTPWSHHRKADATAGREQYLFFSRKQRVMPSSSINLHKG
jgi:hypothetical protein